ncbi:MAG TPA: HAD-IA family hydrolase [Vicinamibacterales bacterium]|nr:HAD-IA family hydrolase [Vicinamibacterales bacterium]
MLIVFDLDGTLIDSRLDLAESTNEMLASYGAPALPIDRAAMMVGEGARKLVERALAASGLDPAEPDALARFRRIYDRRLLLNTRPYPGVPEMLAQVRTLGPLAVLTNKPGEPTRALLDAFDLSSSFRRVIGGDSPYPRKPDPAGLQALMAQFDSAAETTWLVGDSMIDVETARRAGTRACVVLYGFGQLRGELVLDGRESQAKTAADVTRILSGNIL